VLAPDSYTATLRSGADGIRDLLGGFLDGNADGTFGDNHVATFSVVSSAAVVVSVPDFARGPGQVLNLPVASLGLPLQLSSSAGVTSVVLTLAYDSSLLSITGAAVAAGIPDGAVSLAGSTPGLLRVNFTSATALLAGITDFVRLTASVPDTATYGAKNLLDLTSIQINGGAISALDDDGLHVVAYLGDATGSGGISSADAARTLGVAVGLDSGLGSFRLLDPQLIADINGDGRVSALDATRILQQAVGFARPEFPALPANPPTIPVSGPDPLLNIPSFTGRPGDTITVPVNLDVSDGLHAVDLALRYDTTRLEVLSEADIRPGTLTADFDLFQAHLDPAAGTIRVGLASLDVDGLQERGTGSVLEITFRIRADAPAGAAIVNLLHDLAPTTTQLNEGGLVLGPEPSNAAGDVLDGVITVQGAAVPTVQRVVIDDGSGQRSKVTHVTVTFSTVVHFQGNPADAFRLIGPHGRVRLRADVSLDEDGLRTVVRLTFRGVGVRHGSLADGRYTLTIDGDRIADMSGVAVDGDGDGRAGGDAVEEFFRLLGAQEGNGDGKSDGSDVATLLRTLGSRSNLKARFLPRN
jgi:hypothetical protein